MSKAYWASGGIIRNTGYIIFFDMHWYWIILFGKYGIFIRNIIMQKPTTVSKQRTVIPIAASLSPISNYKATVIDKRVYCIIMKYIVTNTFIDFCRNHQVQTITLHPSAQYFFLRVRDMMHVIIKKNMIKLIMPLTAIDDKIEGLMKYRLR